MSTLKMLPKQAQLFFSDLYLLSHLTITLVCRLGTRLKWVVMLVRFLCYLCLLSVAFWRTAFIFIVSDYIKHGIKYGKNSRNNLDIYFANENNPGYRIITKRKSAKKPVVIFISGGAWIIGYKAWGAFMGMLLCNLGIIFVSPDYRNFPQARISNMVEDVSRAVEWVFKNIDKYGGDINNIYLCSQSAGGHIATLTLLQRAYYIEANKNNNNNISKFKNIKRFHSELNWKPTDLKGFFGIASPFNLVEMKEYFDERGLYTDIVLYVMENNLELNSPFHYLFNHFNREFVNLNDVKSSNNNRNNDESDVWSELKINNTKTANVFINDLILKETNNNKISTTNLNKYQLKLPPIFLYHGADDLSVPVNGTIVMAKALATFNIDVYLKIYDNKTHTGPIIEDPIQGTDPLVCDLLKVIFPSLTLDKIVHDIEHVMMGGIQLPNIFINAARYVCPF